MPLRRRALHRLSDVVVGAWALVPALLAAALLAAALAETGGGDTCDAPAPPAETLDTLPDLDDETLAELGLSKKERQRFVAARASL